MRILSLFDGMACGMIAMKLAGVEVESYDAYEIDKYAVKTAQHNFPMIQEHGDVFAADFTKYEGVDFLVGGSPCFTKGHLVLTNKGYKDVSEIVVGDYVLTHTGEYHKVIRTNERTATTVKVDVMGYPTFTTTEDHPFYTLQKRKATWEEYKQKNSWRAFSNKPEWTKAKDLTTNHFCGQHIIGGGADTNLSHEDLWLLGRYVADGHIRKDKRKGRKNSYQYQMIISVGKDKVDAFKRAMKNKKYSFFPHTQSTYRAVFSSMDYVNFIIDNNFGRTASEKRIPEFIFNLPMTKRKSFLDGYLSGDGHFTQGKWTASTVSKELAYGLQRLATSIYITNVSVTVSSPREKVHTIDGRVIKQNFPLYTIIIPEEIKKQSVCHIQDNIIWTQVKSVRNGSTETVYNIEVEGDNSYTVNNLIVHNCTYWSIAQTKNRETVASGMGWELFSQYVRALREAKPKYFIYENNKSMSKQIRASIDEAFGFEAVCINSALVSAQNRQRLYWVGKRNADGTYSKVNVEQPEDRGILLKDVLDSAVAMREKGHAVIASAGRTTEREYFIKNQGNMAAEPINTDAKGNAFCVTSRYYKGFGNNPGKCLEKHRDSMVAEPICLQEQLYGRKAQLDGSYDRRYEARTDGKSGTLTQSMRQEAVAEPINITADGKSYALTGSYFKTAENPFSEFGEEIRRPRVAEPINITADGKAQCLRSTCYKDGIRNIVANDVDRKTGVAEPICVAQRGRMYRGESQHYEARDDGKTNTLTSVEKDNRVAEPIRVPKYGSENKGRPVYEVCDGQITIKGKQYPIKLRDGFYIIRKLTVSECKRLQTVPEWYDFSCVSNSQAYKMLGNGWTCEVIKHLIDSCLNEMV